MTRSVLILAGGGGHTGYATILAEELKGQAELSFMAPEDEPISIERLKSYGPVLKITKPRHPRTNLWSFTFRLMKAFYQSLTRFPRKVDVVVSTGSNFCIPPALVAWIKGIPVVNLESRVKFMKPSRTALLLQYFAKITALQWEEQKRFLKGILFGPLIPKCRVESWNGGYILVTAGTYGYEELFEAVSASSLKKVVLQTGKIDGRKYAEQHPDWVVFSYDPKFYNVIAGAEVVVSPPGGTPLEAVAYGKHVVIVKYPEWTKAASCDEIKLFAQRLNAPIVWDISSPNIESAVMEAEKRDIPKFRDGKKALADIIINL
jgi:UDP-N-acetylglucosamine--N-acetylmuramyl-(pentapeptide) pyrophosphoryl-undecaprenol N-acetylglucosamine transferase